MPEHPGRARSAASPLPSPIRRRAPRATVPRAQANDARRRHTRDRSARSRRSQRAFSLVVSAADQSVCAGPGLSAARAATLTRKPPQHPYAAEPDDPRRTTSRPPTAPQPRSSVSRSSRSSAGSSSPRRAAAFALLWRSPAPLRAEARVDANGTDLLHITCATCPDGTELRIGETKAKIAANASTLRSPRLSMSGATLFAVDIDRPANGRDEKVSLVVKIGYRIRPDSRLLGSSAHLAHRRRRSSRCAR